LFSQSGVRERTSSPSVYSTGAKKYAGQRTQRYQQRAVIAAPIVGENSIGMHFVWRSFQSAISRSTRPRRLAGRACHNPIPPRSCRPGLLVVGVLRSSTVTYVRVSQFFRAMTTFDQRLQQKKTRRWTLSNNGRKRFRSIVHTGGHGGRRFWPRRHR
jgi:hypothetical protein